MSYKLAIANNPFRLVQSKFFFNNVKRVTLIQSDFISNFHLENSKKISTTTRSIPATPIINASQPISNSVEAQDSSLLNNVATKVLNCQSSSERAASASADVSMSHIPFEVKPKENGVKTQDAKAEKTLKQFLDPYLTLTKPRLSVLVMLSSISSYALSPYAVTIPELIFLTAGTCLCSGAANAINMGREPDFDKMMKRTSARPVVRGLITPQQAYQFAAITGTIGFGILYAGVNPTVASLGLINIVLYSWIYTSLKRKSIINTWVGALVGAIPPLMGWAASSPLLAAGSWCIPALLYAWQFPHFNGLSHNIRNEYKKAGYVMTAAENPMLNARVALRYSLLMFPICVGLSYCGITDWFFQIDSAALNGWLTYLAYKFYAQQKENYKEGKFSNPDPNSKGMQMANIYARKMFWGSVWQLPGVLMLAMLHKKGQWDALLSWGNGGEQPFS